MYVFCSLFFRGLWEANCLCKESIVKKIGSLSAQGSMTSSNIFGGKDLIIMKILITGGTGTISSGLVQESVNQGFKTYAITRGTNNVRNISGAIYLKANIWNRDEVNSAIKNLEFDVVVECLVYGVEQLRISLENFGTKCMHFFFISTTGIFRRESNQRIREETPKEIKEWNYTKTKIECEEYLIDYCKKHQLKYTIIRPVVTYGDYRVPFPIATRNPSWSFFDRLKSGKPMLACKSVKFSVMHIMDFSRAVVSLFQNERSMNEDFNIATREGEIFWDDVIEIASQKYGVSSFIVHVPVECLCSVYREIYDEIKWNKSLPLLMDDTKLKSVLPDYTQKIDIVNGINSISDNMEAEFLKNRLRIDYNWNKQCDIVLLYALKKGMLGKEEENRLQQYFRTVEAKYLKELNASAQILFLKNVVKTLLHRW